MLVLGQEVVSSGAGEVVACKGGRWSVVFNIPLRHSNFGVGGKTRHRKSGVAREEAAGGKKQEVCSCEVL